MQFIPSTWSVVGVDADGDAKRNPQDIDDASLATAVYLCSGDDDLATDAGRRSSVFRYNHSEEYVDLVLAFYDAYVAGDYTSVPNSAGGGGTIPPGWRRRWRRWWRWRRWRWRWRHADGRARAHQGPDQQADAGADVQADSAADGPADRRSPRRNRPSRPRPPTAPEPTKLPTANPTSALPTVLPTQLPTILPTDLPTSILTPILTLADAIVQCTAPGPDRQPAQQQRRLRPVRRQPHRRLDASVRLRSDL